MVWKPPFVKRRTGSRNISTRTELPTRKLDIVSKRLGAVILEFFKFCDLKSNGTTEVNKIMFRNINFVYHIRFLLLFWVIEET